MLCWSQSANSRPIKRISTLYIRLGDLVEIFCVFLINWIAKLCSLLRFGDPRMLYFWLSHVSYITEEKLETDFEVHFRSYHTTVPVDITPSLTPPFPDNCYRCTTTSTNVRLPIMLYQSSRTPIEAKTSNQIINVIEKKIQNINEMPQGHGKHFRKRYFI